ncbi:PTS sugar transporter subunit IIA [Streptococcus hongkongensis]|nr:PTS galactose transporter subunit IIA [Streptococcus uberis]
MKANVLFTEASSLEELFDVVSQQLLALKLVKPDYQEAIKVREKEFPTGLKIDYKDGSPILFAAIPHTETKYCLSNQVVYVQNNMPITVKHMINPEEDCFVQHFFFIVNNKNDGQTTILSNLITFFVTKGNLEQLTELGNNVEKISEFLEAKGVLEYD